MRQHKAGLFVTCRAAARQREESFVRSPPLALARRSHVDVEFYSFFPSRDRDIFIASQDVRMKS